MKGVLELRKKQKKYTQKQAGMKAGWRSGLEEVVAQQLTDYGVAYEYEKLVIHYVIPERKAKYTPDFHVLLNGIILESKGRFVLEDRKKHLLIKRQYPNLDIRFIFSNSRQKISKTSQTTYADWCRQHGFLYADKVVPEAWINEPPKS